MQSEVNQEENLNRIITVPDKAFYDENSISYAVMH